MDESVVDHNALANTPLDLASYVQEVNRFSVLLRPLVFVYVGVYDIRRWKTARVSIGCLVIFNLIGLFFSQGDVFVLSACLLFLLSALSLFHIHTRLLDRFLPATQLNTEESLMLEDTGADDGMKNVRDFRVSLVQIYMFLMRVNRALTRFFALLKWDDFKLSLRFYLTLATFLICFVVFPVRWNYIIYINWFFLSHKRVEKYVRRKCGEIIEGRSKHPVSVAGTPTMNNGVVEPCDPTDQQIQGGEAIDVTQPCADWRHPDIKTISDLDSDSSDSDALYPSSTSAATEAVPKKGVVSRILEFKRKKQQMMAGNCHGCQSSFTSILKRRHYCRHCGNHFCAKCCCQKVPRSVFGATSPAAQTETVPVCNSCYTTLFTKSLKIL